ncbi:MAG: roadblock/LC7 domain-containing protein [Acidobacteria bacterium]|nr:roadblock/LC7 domain-containing protein [Acidobacteriota bacterium]
MFKNALQQISAKVEGVLGVMIVAHDGLIIEQISHSSDLNLELMGAEFSGLLKSVRRFAKGSDIGTIQEMTLQTGQARLLFRAITDEYYLLLVMEREAIGGRAQHELRKAQLLLEKEFIL